MTAVQASHTTWPKAVDTRIQQALRLRDVSPYARAAVAVGFARQQVEREGLSDEPREPISFAQFMDRLLAKAFPNLCDGCGRGDTELVETPAGGWHCADCTSDTAYDSNGDRT